MINISSGWPIISLSLKTLRDISQDDDICFEWHIINLLYKASCVDSIGPGCGFPETTIASRDDECSVMSSTY